MLVSETNSKSYKLGIRDVEIEEVQKCRYMRRAMRDHEQNMKQRIEDPEE